MSHTGTLVHEALELARGGIVECLVTRHHDGADFWINVFAKRHGLESAPERWSLTNMLWFLGVFGHKALAMSDMARALAYELRAWGQRPSAEELSLQDAYRIVDSVARLLQQLRVSQEVAARSLRDSLWQHRATPKARAFIVPEEVLQKLRQPLPPEDRQVVPLTLAELCHVILENTGEFMSSRDIHHHLQQAGFRYNLKSISLTLGKDPRFIKHVVGRRYFWGLAAWAHRPHPPRPLTKIAAALKPKEHRP